MYPFTYGILMNILLLSALHQLKGRNGEGCHQAYKVKVNASWEEYGIKKKNQHQLS